MRGSQNNYDPYQQVKSRISQRRIADKRDRPQRRASLRADGQPLTGRALVNTLTSYSERGEEYVESLQAIIRVNKLAPADDAYLLDMTPIDLVPVGAGVVPASD